MICACQIRPTDMRLIRKTQTARAKFVCDSRAGKRSVRMSQDMYGPPSTLITQQIAFEFFALKLCNSIAKEIPRIHRAKSECFLQKRGISQFKLEMSVLRVCTSMGFTERIFPLKMFKAERLVMRARLPRDWVLLWGFPRSVKEPALLFEAL